MELRPDQKDKRIKKIELGPVFRVLNEFLEESKNLNFDEGGGMELVLKDQKVFELNEDKIIFLEEEMGDRVREEDVTESFNPTVVSGFLKGLEGRIKRLNHTGISYYVFDIESEKNKITKKAKDFGLNVYEEESGLENETWLFVGDAEQSEDPMFEIVLVEGPGNSEDSWKPHIQIDLDTDLTIEEIEEAKKELGPNIDTWELDVPEVGPVLWMANLGSTGGARILLGLGTNSRNTRWHREQGMRKVD